MERTKPCFSLQQVMTPDFTNKKCKSDSQNRCNQSIMQLWPFQRVGQRWVWPTSYDIYRKAARLLPVGCQCHNCQYEDFPGNPAGFTFKLELAWICRLCRINNILQVVLQLGVLGVKGGLLGAGTGGGSCRAAPFRAAVVQWTAGCPNTSPCCSEYGYCRTRVKIDDIFLSSLLKTF